MTLILFFEMKVITTENTEECLIQQEITQTLIQIHGSPRKRQEIQ